ncbi:MAG: ABC transporter ATP-binding protein [Desulfomonilaceae bacterium]
MNQIIQVHDLVKNFGNFCAVSHVSFDVSEGGIFGFLGPNGAGKTTIIKMLTTILKPTSGSIRVDGYDTVKEQHQVRSRIGIVFQDPSLDGDMTALENLQLHGILYGLSSEARKTGIEKLLRLVQLWERRKDFVRNFSGGMKRRLEIARALLHEPKVVFLDEPTLGLDPQTRNHIWNYIRALNSEKNITVFFTTHYMEEADRVANEIAIMDQGKIIAQGAPSDLKDLTQTRSLEDAFITLTGYAIRPEEASAFDRMRTIGKIWGRR